MLDVVGNIMGKLGNQGKSHCGNLESYLKAYLVVFGLQQFQGNLDSNSIVSHHVPRPATVKSVRIIPTDWEKNFAIRLELYGCIVGEYN